MKICLIQPLYGTDESLSDELFERELEALRSCDESMDLIVMPEASDSPVAVSSVESRRRAYEKYNRPLLELAAATAARCRSILCVNARSVGEGGLLRNTTYVFDREGKEAGRYYKQHLTPGEQTFLDRSYTLAADEPTVVTVDGLRLCFLTCYDFYFYESFASIARANPDIIIGCSHQRTDTKEALETFSRCAAYNTNAYVVRASVSLGEDSKVGGCSMVVTPDGSVLCNMESRVGVACVEIDPHKKYSKPAGFRNPQSPHKDYIEKGRRPWKYRPAGPGTALPDDLAPYPRVCAHRGFNTVAPENSMPAFGAAVALGAPEIEFDLWRTSDGKIVSTHDARLDRVSDGEGYVWEHTLEELRKLDFGSKYGEKFAGLRIPTFAEILEKFTCRCIMNVHVKTSDHETYVYDEEWLREIVRLIRRYDCEKYAYFMSGDDRVLEFMQREAPDIGRCVGAGKRPYEMVARALEYGCGRIQLFKDKYTPDMIEDAHAHGIKVNAYYADTPERAQMYLDQGVDTILSNDYLAISRYVEEHK